MEIQYNLVQTFVIYKESVYRLIQKQEPVPYTGVDSIQR